ncbi:MAG: PEP-CTERM sorting domain-containing protein [Phycisphaerae bacterium]|nr:PEP-CTERM sorting domain-containing protein [Gemmatimonadaceae bacterium]
MRRISPKVALLLALISLPSVAQAQLVSTGASQSGNRDLRWDVSTNAGASWTQAFVVTSVPGQWTAGAPGGTWVSATASGSGGGGSYAVRSLFTLASGDAFSFDFRCATDNAFAGMFINGTQFGSNHCPSLWTWGSFVSVGSSNFLAGQNSVEFRWTGDNVTDGIAVDLNNQRFVPGPTGPGTVVPEPSAIVLLASGLLGLGVVARRRRQR